MNWEKLEVLRQEYSDNLEKSFSKLGYQNEDLEEALEDDFALFEVVDTELARIMCYQLNPGNSNTNPGPIQYRDPTKPIQDKPSIQDLKGEA